MKTYPWLWRFFILPRHYRQYCDLDRKGWSLFPAGGPPF